VSAAVRFLARNRGGARDPLVIGRGIARRREGEAPFPGPRRRPRGIHAEIEALEPGQVVEMQEEDERISIWVE